MDSLFYQVQIELPKSIQDEFLLWLRPHIKDMTDLPCFSRAELAEVENALVGKVILQARYFYQTSEDFDKYLHVYAQKMRGDLPEEFKNQLHFKRALGSLNSL